VCAIDALYCGRCGHSLTFSTTDDELTGIGAVEHRYDLDMLIQLAGVNHHDKKPKIDETKSVQVNPDAMKQGNGTL
jgi:hypothetical protein